MICVKLLPQYPYHLLTVLLPEMLEALACNAIHVLYKAHVALLHSATQACLKHVS